MGFGYKVHRDKNHMPILNHLRKLEKPRGLKVIDLAATGNSFPDLITATAIHVVLIEIKMEGAQIYLKQLEFMAKWPNYGGFATNEEQAENLALRPEEYALKDWEKIIVGEIAAEWTAKTKAASNTTKPKIAVNLFDKEFAKRREQYVSIPF